MKIISKGCIFCTVLLSLTIWLTAPVFSQPPNTKNKPAHLSNVRKISLPCVWTDISENTNSKIYKVEKTSCLVNTSFSLNNPAPSVYGAFLDLKYYSGMSYFKLQEKLPGKKISVKVTIPRTTLKNLVPGEPKLRLGLKAVTGNSWVDLTQETEWKEINSSGPTSLEIIIPKDPISNNKSQIFYPEDTRVLAVELWTGSLKPVNGRIILLIEDLVMEDLPLDAANLKWKLIKEHVTQEDAFLPVYPKNSIMVIPADKIDLNCQMDLSADTISSINVSEQYLLSLPIAIRYPETLDKITFSIKMILPDGTTAITDKTITKEDPEEKFNILFPLNSENISSLIEKAITGLSVELRITPSPNNIPVPVIIEPVSLNEGTLIPFDSTWEERDIQNLGGYKCLDLTGTPEPCGITFTHPGSNPYSIFSTLKLEGGMKWNNPFKRIELKKDLDNSPVNLAGRHIELSIRPITNTMLLWQTPYRARVGLLDANNNVMFGPNISLSEGVANIALLDVTLATPTPKGLAMPNFDPTSVSSILINIESPQKDEELINLSLAFDNLVVQKNSPTIKNGYKSFDFSRFSVEPDKWTIKKIIDENGGFTAGINYPFPTIIIPPKVLEVPQIYPAVGKKPDDPGHFGLSSPLTKAQTIKDLSYLTSKGIKIIRFFILGHLDGVFNWNISGKTIEGFTDEQEDLFTSSIGMSIEEFAKFLHKNEHTLFPDPEKINGLGSLTLTDSKALLDILDSVEESSGIRPSIILTLYDFTFADTTKEEGPLKKYIVGEHPEIVTDPLTRIKAYALIWKTVKTLYQDPRFIKYIGAIDIINEPSNAVALVSPDTFPQFVNMVGDTLYLVKDIVNPNIPVTIGFRSWPYDLTYWSSLGDGVDILMPHYWESLESYNINTPGLWPLEMKASKLWELLGTSKGKRLTALGEIAPEKENVKKDIETIRAAGYDFVLLWSFSGHDGFNAKSSTDEMMSFVKTPKEETL